MKKTIILGVFLSLFIPFSCSRDNDTIINEEIISQNTISRTNIDNFSADYGKLLENISKTKNRENIEIQIKNFGEKYNYEYKQNEYATFSKLDKNTPYDLSQNIKEAIEKSDDNFHSIIKSLTILKENENLSDEDYLITSLLIETLKVKSKEIISYDYAIKLYHGDIDKNKYTTFAKKDKSDKNKAKCAAMVIGSGIGGAIAGCKTGTPFGGAVGCTIGATIGFIGGVLVGYGSSDDC